MKRECRILGLELVSCELMTVLGPKLKSFRKATRARNCSTIPLAPFSMDSEEPRVERSQISLIFGSALSTHRALCCALHSEQAWVSSACFHLSLLSSVFPGLMWHGIGMAFTETYDPVFMNAATSIVI